MKELSNIKILLSCLVISIVLYGNTLWNDYALDDSIVIIKNAFTQQGFAGIKDIFTHETFTGFFGIQKDLVSGGRYRPLSLVTFAIEHQFFGNAPVISHLINILLYALIGYLIFLVIQRLLIQQMDQKPAWLIAALSMLVFLVHPIHTECVANIKGRDELMSLLFSLWAFYLALKYLDQKKIIHLLLAAFILFLGTLSKENAIVFVVIIPFSIWFFYKDSKTLWLSIAAFLLFPAMMFIVVRTKVLGGLTFEPANELMNNPFIGTTGAEKLATILYTWLIYLKLLIVPHPLTFDYYPKQIPIMHFGNWQVLLSVAILGLLIYMVLKNWKNKRLITFCIIGFALPFSLVSNLVFSVGTFMNERFVFMSSVFWSLAAAYLIYTYLLSPIKGKPNKLILMVLGIYLLGFYPIKTIARNRAWKDDLTLFTTDVKTSSNSAKSNCSAGGKLWEAAKELPDGTKQKQYYELSEKYLRKAVKIHTTYTDAWLLLGNVLYDSKKDIKGSATCYMNVLNLKPSDENAYKNIDIVLTQSKDHQLQKDFYLQLLKIFPDSYIPNYRLGVIYARFMNDLPTGIKYLEKAVETDKSKTEALKDLGTAYGISQQSEKAYHIFSQLVKIDSTDAQAFINLGIACQQLNKMNEAERCFAKAKGLEGEK